VCKKKKTIQACAGMRYILQSAKYSARHPPSTALHCTAPHRTAPHRTAPHRTALHRTAPESDSFLFFIYDRRLEKENC
jgi:hypothetical protein